MAKKDRFPEGYSTGCAPTCESEGSGSSGRFDREITAAEDSGAPMRKCISKNSARNDDFGVHTHVLPLSKLLPTERKVLVQRLRAELQQIQVVQKRVQSLRTNGVTLSSSSDLLSSSNAQSGPSAEKFRKSMALTSRQVKKLNPPAQKEQGWNRGTTGKFVSSMEAAAPNTSSTILIKQCEALLQKLMSHPYGWVFNTPVDVVKLNIPDYFTVIKHPMDLGTVKNKLASSKYGSLLDFATDVRLTFSNAMAYNPAGNNVHLWALTLSKIFESRWKAIEKKLPINCSQLLAEKTYTHEEKELIVKPTPQSKKRKITSFHKEVMLQPMKRLMTDEDKQNLTRDLEALPGELPDNIVVFLRQQSSKGRDSDDDEIEIDIGDLSDDTLFKLRKLLDEYLQEKQMKLEKTEACEIKSLNESGLSNSSRQPCEGNGPVEEDFEIGENGPPVSSHSLLEVENDSDRRSNKYSVPSNSEGELDGAQTSSPLKISKENLGPDAVLNKHTDVAEMLDGNKSVSGLDQLEQISWEKPNSVESDGHQNGEGFPTQRPVSPKKLYRAALLKNRFADTILKAREKTFNEGEKGDPEKLRREREELEVQRRKEKARLLAEAKAAEGARRRAEAEASAEAKRKRELQREAARQALQKMKKTVEINETSRFLEDLEMLTAAPSEQLPSSVDEESPEHCQDGLGSFKFGSSNPLEQLGLYMKVDEEEEEGEAGPPALNTVSEVEEGEID